MKIDKNGVEFIVSMEGLELKAYKCSAGVWTVGIGSTRYEDGTPVKKGDVITRDRALLLFKNTISIYENAVNKLVTSSINQNQYNALTSFCYNLGVSAFKGSTLLKKVNLNPNDPNITLQLNKWINAGGRPVKGLIIRRMKESKLYFS